ncbi:DUF3820 family protein [Psychromonas ossibalaenae]|uniref:DUF3820 family protein n=1 Tax=Psychromonas ossibalaenae TaxID=444922 RepID=UPI000370537B|nr:DUF3820 family protein [Psychromonas ossibalaenae]
MLDDPKALSEALNQIMPFGKYAGRKLIHLPEPYLVWFNSKGFPEGKLGRQLALMYEVKLNGLEKMLEPLIKYDGADTNRFK